MFNYFWVCFSWLAPFKLFFLLHFFPILHFSVMLNCHKNVIILIAYGWYGTFQEHCLIWHISAHTSPCNEQDFIFLWNSVNIIYTVFRKALCGTESEESCGIFCLMSELRKRAKTKILKFNSRCIFLHIK